ncbi:MAG: redoxin domain-containing protein [Candidatus Nealsonbacteria bacterium]|nr:redoxin domain-containing protein [Candidatus Nealsonbacteria bacterium]
MIDQNKRPGNVSRLLSACLISGCLTLVAAYTTGCNSASDATGDGEQTGKGDDGGKQPVGEPKTGREVLQRMAAAYRKASSYADKGTIRLASTVDGEEKKEELQYVIAMVRPNKIRAEAGPVKYVCDGKKAHASILYLPDQVMSTPAPEKLTVKSIRSHGLWANAMNQSFVERWPRLNLLLADDPLARLLDPDDEPELSESGQIGDRTCYRVKIKRSDGMAVYWIDRESYVLRRLTLPTGQLRAHYEQQGTVEHLSLEADFIGARLGGPVEPVAFEFAVPDGAELVEYFLPMRPEQLLGKKVPQFTFADMQGKAVTPESMAGKITVLDFWATWCGYCPAALTKLADVAPKYKDKVAFYAVSIDNPQIENKTLEETFVKWGVPLPIVRDAELKSGVLFKFDGVPVSFILDAKGVVQDVKMGGDPALTTVLPEKLDKLLAGEDIYHEPLKEYLNEMELFRSAMEQLENANTGQNTQMIPAAPAETAKAIPPETFKLVPLWENTDLAMPGNIMVVPTPDSLPRLLVVDSGTSVVEMGLDGKPIRSHPMGLEPNELVFSLRTIADADGHRYFAAVGMSQQRFHLFDQQWQALFRYPADALSNPHKGIADVQLADLDGDGTPEAYVGYWGVVGVHGVSLTGERLWRNGSIANVMRIAPDAPDAEGRRLLLCANDQGSLAQIDAAGVSKGNITIRGKTLQGIVTADVDGDGQLDYCALAGRRLEDNTVIGLDAKGNELWQYTLPSGVHSQPVEPVVAGRLSPATPGQWLLPGPDGSIHILSVAGKLLDRFNTGVPLQGLATATYQNQMILLVSSKRGVQAWKVE